MKLFYIANARLPTEKAHGFQIMKMCEAFARAGEDVELVIPRRVNTPQMQRVRDVWAHYGIETPFTITRIPCLDWQFLVGVSLDLWWRLIEFTFGLSVLRFLIHQRTRNQSCVVYTRDERATPWLLRFRQFLNLRVFFEAHNTHGSWYAQRFLGVDGLIAITEHLQREFIDAGLAPDRCLVAPDGVDLSKYARLPDRMEARRRLGLPCSGPIVCYTGHLLRWKGVYTLVESATQLPEAQFLIVGGMPEDIKALRRFAASQHTTNVQLVGHVAPTEVPLYQAAADVLVLPNSARETISAHYTSPLKLFEYMAAGRPIVASDLPSIREVLTDRVTAMLVKPDDPLALASKLTALLGNSALQRQLAAQAQSTVERYGWRKRAAAIVEFLVERTRSTAGVGEPGHDSRDWDEYAQHSGTTGFPSEMLTKYAGVVVLDAGGGVGAHLAQIPAARVRVDCEISLQRLRQGKARYAALQFVQASGYHLPVVDGGFDTIISIDVIEHLRDPASYMAEIQRVLRPGGRLILQTPNYPVKRLYDLVNYWRHAWRRTLADDPTHVSRFSWWQLEKLIGKYLSIVESTTRNVFLEWTVAYLHSHKGGRIAKTFGQKTIVIAEKAAK